MRKLTALPQEEGHRAVFSFHVDVTGNFVHFAITASQEEGTTVPTPGTGERFLLLPGT